MTVHRAGDADAEESSEEKRQPIKLSFCQKISSSITNGLDNFFYR